jgi:predicted DNA-binding helix-hairpin-helix protein
MGAGLEEKLTSLSAAAQFDVCASCDAPTPEVFTHSITRLRLPSGGCLSVLKILMTDACQYDCFYCANRAGRRMRRHALKAHELTRAFLDLQARGLVNGLFLSSGVPGSPSDAMCEMLAAAEMLRERHDFRGYLHLKVLPGAPYDCVCRAVELADRVSVNVEAPTQRALDQLSTSKQLAGGVIERMHWIRQAAERAGPGRLRSGQTTQFVVGAAGESDREILNAAEALRRSVGLRRAYFSAFRPVPGTPLEGEPATPPLRQHRLYQADWLLRCYGFTMGELAFDARGHLSLDRDPKLAYALARHHQFPIEVNRATREELLRVPGIGPRSVGRIIAARRQGRISSLDELQNLGVVIRRAGPFLLVNGRHEGQIADLLRHTQAAGAQLQLDLSPVPATR